MGHDDLTAKSLMCKGFNLQNSFHFKTLQVSRLTLVEDQWQFFLSCRTEACSVTWATRNDNLLCANSCRSRCKWHEACSTCLPTRLSTEIWPVATACTKQVELLQDFRKLVIQFLKAVLLCLRQAWRELYCQGRRFRIVTSSLPEKLLRHVK